MKKSTLFCLFVLALLSPTMQAASSCSCSCGDADKGSLYHGLGIKGRFLKQCTFNKINDNRDNGQIRTCGFTKSQTNTALRVTWQGDLRMVGCTSTKCCRRWFITINGKECSSPAPIDAVIYANLNLNLHRPGTLDGFCENIPKGRVTVGISVGACPNPSHPTGDAYTGWDSVSRLIIEEVPPLQ